MNRRTSVGAGPPSSHTMRYASGSKEAATSEAPNICRGTPGAIIAKMRIRSAIQDGRPISGAPAGKAGIAQALAAAMRAAFISIIAMPTVLLCSAVVSARRRYHRMMTEPTTPAISIGMIRQFLTHVSESAGSRAMSRRSANDQSTDATVVNTVSRAACSVSSSVGSRVARPVSRRSDGDVSSRRARTCRGGVIPAL